MIELTTLRYFLSAYDSGSFSQAARENCVSQPTVSAAIQKLEDRLGSVLFIRSRSGLTPTPIARRLYQDAQNSVNHLAGLEGRLKSVTRRPLRIWSAPDMLLNGISRALNSLAQRRGELVFSFTDDPQNCDIAWLTRGCTPVAHSFVPLKSEAFGLAVSQRHPLAALPAVSLSDIQDAPLIHRPYCPNADHITSEALPMPAAAQAIHDAQLLDLVAAGLGQAFVPQSHTDQRDDIAWLPLRDVPPVTRTIGISHRKTAFAKEIAQDLTEKLKTL